MRPLVGPGATWLLPLYCGLGFGVAYYVLTSDDRIETNSARLARLALEIGVGCGLVFWLILRILGLGGGGTFIGAAVAHVVVRAALWGIVTWPFTSWRIERRLGLPYHRSYDLTTSICGVTLLLLFILASAAAVARYL